MRFTFQSATALLVPLLCLGLFACNDAESGDDCEGLLCGLEEGDVGEVGADTSTDAETEPEFELPEGAEVISISTWNVQRFFDDNCDSGSCGSGSFESVPDELTFESRARRVASAIVALDSDIVVLQEIENENCIDALVAQLADQGLTYQTVTPTEIGGGGSLDVAILAQGEELNLTLHRASGPRIGGTLAYTRELPELELNINGAQVIVFGAHFKSKSNDNPNRRLLEAEATHQRMLEASQDHPDALILLAGDLNDFFNSAPMNALELDDQVAFATRELPSDASTVQFDGGQLIDHIGMSTTASGLYIPGSVEVLSDSAGYGYGASDHRAVRAEYAVMPSL